jgi:7-keto-8-aminopelargonate synthetase-like enzyme
MNAIATETDFFTGKTVTGPVSARMVVDGREYINFFGAAYLALSGLREIREAVRKTLDEGVPYAQQVPAAFGATDPIFDGLERAGAAACGSEASVYFASGYLIGTVAQASFAHPFDLILIDEAAHYSLYDSAKLSGLPTIKFVHCDVESLREMLKRHVNPSQRPLLMTDGVFATTGRIPPLEDYAAALEKFDGRMVVDEAHSFGVVGANGRGAAEYCRVEHISATGASLSKAYCAQGALVGCSADAALRLRSIPQIRGACAGSPLSAVAASVSLSYVANHPEIRRELRATTDYLRQRLRAIGVDVMDSPAPIVAFQSGNRTEMLALQKRLVARDIYLHFSTYVGSGSQGILRCAVFHDHTKEDIDALVDAMD